MNAGSWPWGVAVNPTGTKVYVTNCNIDTVSVIDTATNTVTDIVTVGTYPYGVAVSSDGKKVYVTNELSNNVSVIDTTTDVVTATVNVGLGPHGVAVSPDGKKVYVTDYDDSALSTGNVSVINTTTNIVTATINVGRWPRGIAVNLAGTKVYVANHFSNTVSVIDTATDTLTATVNVGTYPYGVAVTPDGKKVYVANTNSNTVSVIDTATNNVVTMVPVGHSPSGVTVTPDGKEVYVANRDSNTVSIIDTATDTLTDTVNVGDSPSAFGQFISPLSALEPLLPVANFSSDVTTGNTPLSVQFTDLSEKATEWNWSFGDGNTSTEQNPTHTYSAAGIYTVNLTATNANGTDSKLATITVLEKSASIICKVVGTNYQYWSNEQYPIIDLFGEQEVPLLANNDPIWQPHVNKLAKLVLDNNKKYTLKNSEKLDLGQDYTLEVKQIDVDGKKVWLEFTKDGEFVDDQIVSTDAGSNTWTCELDKIQGEDNVPVLKVHVNQVFQSANDSIAQIDGLWLIDYANAKTLEVGDKFGEFTLAQIINGVDESNLGSLVFEFSSFEYPVYAYITNTDSNTVSVIDTATNTVIATVNVGSYPFGVAVNPVGTKIYVPNEGSNDVSIIDTATNTVTATVKVGFGPHGAAVNPEGTKVYVTNYGDNNVSVIDTATNTVTATVNVGGNPQGVAVTPDGTKLYVVNYWDSTVSVIDTATNIVTATVPVGYDPNGVAVNPEGTKVYVTTSGDSTVSVIDTTTNTVTATVPVGRSPFGVAFTPDGKKVYVTNQNDGSVSVIDTATNNVIATVNVGSNPFGIAVNPEGTKIYVANGNSNNVSVIDSATNNVIATVNVGDNPIGFGQFIVPPSALTQVLHVTNFTANTTEGTTPLTVKFTDTSTNSPTRWKWNFGDDQTSTVQNPEHTFSGAGVYTVTLVVINGDGASGVKSMNITVNRVPTPPVANFTAKQTGLLTVQFNDMSLNEISGRTWTFGDGSTSTDANPTHTYAAAGTYAVNLTVSNADGTNATSKKITVTATIALPKASFTASPLFGRAPLTVKFTDKSTNATSIKWDFGEKSAISTESKTSHIYKTRGFYTVKLTATNGGNSNVATKTIFVARRQHHPRN